MCIYDPRIYMYLYIYIDIELDLILHIILSIYIIIKAAHNFNRQCVQYSMVTLPILRILLKGSHVRLRPT